MFELIYFTLCILSFNKLAIKGFNSFFTDYMNINNVNQIKGVCVWMIFFRHSTEYFPKKLKLGKISILIDKSLGQNIVSPFLLYSGYGINESFLKKGNQYIKSLPKKSGILFIKTQIILLFFLFNNIYLGKNISIKRYLLAMIFKKGIGNSYWFAFTIINLYIYSFLSFILIKNKKFDIIGIILITIFCFFHILFVYKFYHKNQLISVDTIICFVLGFYYSFLKPHLDKVIIKNDYNYYGILIFLTIFYYKFLNSKNHNIFNISLKNFFYVLIIVFISMKIKFESNFLTLLNSHSYSIYLLQRLVMIHIHKKRFFEKHEFISFYIQFLIVIFISIIFDKYTYFINDLFKKKEFEKIEHKCNEEKSKINFIYN